MTITAKFSSVCPVCKKRISQGEKVEWNRGEKARHVTCAAPLEETRRDLPHDQRIEPARGATYGPTARAPFAVYTYDFWPRGSVLAGQQRRTFNDNGTLEELKAKYPNAAVASYSGYQEPYLGHLPEYGDVE